MMGLSIVCQKFIVHRLKVVLREPPCYSNQQNDCAAERRQGIYLRFPAPMSQEAVNGRAQGRGVVTLTGCRPPKPQKSTLYSSPA
jgi:hypothetical protein